MHYLFEIKKENTTARLRIYRNDVKDLRELMQDVKFKNPNSIVLFVGCYL